MHLGTQEKKQNKKSMHSGVYFTVQAWLLELEKPWVVTVNCCFCYTGHVFNVYLMVFVYLKLKGHVVCDLSFCFVFGC